MTELIRLLEKLKSAGIINQYAIGGATALVFYFEPINTVDVDVFVILAGPDQPLVNLTPIYSFFSEAGHSIKKEYILVNQVPVQFLVPYNDLLVEAVHHPRKVKYGKARVNILELEYLMSIMVQTGRLKDKARLSEIESHVTYSRSKLARILKRHGLWKKWLNLQDEFSAQ